MIPNRFVIIKGLVRIKNAAQEDDRTGVVGGIVDESGIKYFAGDSREKVSIESPKAERRRHGAQLTQFLVEFYQFGISAT